MFISQIEMFGFKSFAPRTRLELQPGVTCVVGPNGSGKTNILDALRWVLGEQKSSTLRSDKMENVIFTGSVNRKPMGMSEVTLTIQNSKGVLPSEYNEVQVARRLYRNGESEYLLNRQVCRLKDIQDLFVDTGLGPDSYSVIELKMVEDILSERAEARRQLFEEAAGVTRFKGRRRSAINKLESTRLDMQRIEDILSEVRRNVNSLKRQVGRARRYQSSRETLLEQETVLLASEEVYHQERLQPLQAERQTAHERITSLETDAIQLRTTLTRRQAEVAEFETEFTRKQSEMDERRRDYHARSSELAVQREQRKHALATAANARTEQEKLAAQKEQAEQRRRDLAAGREELAQETARLEAAYREEEEHLNRGEQELAAQREQTEAQQQDLLDVLHALAPVESDISKNESVLAGCDERLEVIAAAEQRLETELAANMDRIEQTDLERRSAEEQSQAAVAEMERLQSEWQSASQLLREKERAVLEASLAEKELLSRTAFLEDLLTRHEGLPGGVSLVLEAALPGISGPLGDLVSAPPQYIPALETALGAAVNYLLAADRSAIEQARELLRAEGKGQVTFIDLSLVPEPEATDDSGRLIEVIECEPALRPLLAHLLSDVSFSDEDRLDESRTTGRQLNGAGEMFAPPALHVVGSRSEAGASAIGRTLQLDQLRTELDEIARKLAESRHDCEEAAVAESAAATAVTQATAALEQQRETVNQLTSAHLRLDEIKTHLTNQLEAYRQEAEEWQQRQTAVKAELQTGSQQQSELLAQRGEMEASSAGFRERLLSAELDVSHVRAQVQQSQVHLMEKNGDLRNLEDKLAELAGFIETAAQTQTEHIHTIQTQEELAAGLADSEREAEQTLVADLQKLEEDEQSLSGSVQKLEEHRSALRELQQQLDRNNTEKDEHRERMHSIELITRETEVRLQNRREALKAEYDLEVTPADLKQVDREITAARLEELQTEAQRLRELLKRLGPVNLLALEEFEQEQERLEFLEEQREDLQQSETMLLESINKINRVARERFEETFKKIQANFEYLFGKLFYDGKARLTLDAGDPLEANVGIYAAPSGKKIQHLSLLSGGEKTLTAIALLFSIYMVKPSPFCILDEVDAPLDDSNITKFNILIREFTEETQFIIITHNKRTMEYADTMYGVTMAEEGVSSIVSVKFSEETVK